MPSDEVRNHTRCNLTTAAQTGDAKGVATRTATPPEKGIEAALQTVIESLDDSKAEGMITIDIRGKSPLGDYMVVASGRSHRHVGAIADHLLSDLKDKGYGNPRVEGLPNCDWVLVDTGDIIVHIFRPEVREFYGIEKMWKVPEQAEVH
jgi:ribosome-associated protein